MGRVLKTLTVLCLFLALFIAAGSAYTQLRIKNILKEQALSSFAVVLSKPFAIAPGVNPYNAKIEERLARLRYSLGQEIPSRPGQARLDSSSLTIFLRKFTDASGIHHEQQLIRAAIDGKGRVTSVKDVSTDTEIPVAWLEPESLSTLGSNERRAVTPARLAEVSKWLPKALVTVEDERFFNHFGVDPIGILRALVVNMKSGSLRQGGSTLTQQLAKNLFYGNQRTLKRKAKEAVAAVLIETAFSKEEILELYINEIFLGQEGRVAIHGFGEASLSFFGKAVSDLTVSEAATLVGMVKAPSYYSLRRHPKRARARRDIVLGKMLEQGVINEKQYLASKDEALNIKQVRRSRRQAPYYVDYLRSVLAKVIPVESLALQPIQIHSGIDVAYQNCAEKAVNEGLQSLEKKFPRLKRKKHPLQAALVSLTPANGEFLAWVGGRDYRQSQFEHISLAARQTGSVFKPFVFLTALDRDLNNYRAAKTTNLLSDEPIKLQTVAGSFWEPKNYDKKFHGDVTLRQALVRSLNIPAVQLIQKVGVANVVRTTHLLGIKRNIPEVPAIALGAAELTPLEVARGYATIANGGRLARFRPIRSITKTGSQKVLFESPLRDVEKVSETAAFVLTDMLVSAVSHGTGRAVARSGYHGLVAGKTGTTNSARDAWFAGYTPRLLSVVWVGFDDNAKTGLTGGQAAAPIWSSYMQCVKSMEPDLSFVAPPGVVYRKIDTTSGLLATSDCPAASTTTEIFIEGTHPVTSCREHQGGGYFAENRDIRRARIQGGRNDSRKKGFIRSLFDKLWR